MQRWKGRVPELFSTDSRFKSLSAAERMGGNCLAVGFSGSSSLRGLVWSLVVFVSPCTLLNLSHGNCKVIFGY